MSAVIHFEHVWKRYKLHYQSLRDAIPDFFGRLVGRSRGHQEHSDFYALKDVTFEVEKGEALGIIGPNGAGKSTALKLLSHITEPTRGKIQVDGNVAALIEIAAGFHPDLTGRENVYLYGSVMGLRRKEIDERFHSIVEFAELEDFIDTPIKRYSSGMQVRLGFSVIAHLDPDVLLVDEVLAVGDMSFRKKCQERMRAFLEMGKTIVFVSHNISAIQALCGRAVYLNRGQIRAIGESKEVVSLYIDETNKAELERSQSKTSRTYERWGTGEARITAVEVTDKNGTPRDSFETGDAVRLVMSYRALTRIPEPDFRLLVRAPGGVYVSCASSARSGYVPEYIEGDGNVEFIFESIPFLPRTYSVYANIRSLNGRTDYDTFPDAVHFTVTVPDPRSSRLRDELPVGEYTLIHVPYSVRHILQV